MPNHVLNILTLNGHKLYTESCIHDIANTDTHYTCNTIDFNKILPMPASLNVSEGSENYRSILAYMAAVDPDLALCCRRENLIPLGRTSYEKALSLLPYDAFKFQAKNATECKDQIDNFRQHNANIKEEDYEKLIATGDKLIHNLLNHGATTWYTWCINNWGTKWNAYNFDTQNSINNLIIFNTAWSAPIPVIKQLSKKYPDIYFTLEWADEDFGANTGVIRFLNGNELSSNIPPNLSKEAYELASKITGIDLDDEYDFDEKSGTYVYREE